MRFDIVTPQGASLESLAMSPDGRTMALDGATTLALEHLALVTDAS